MGSCFKFGLYRHFKGEVYFALNLLTSNDGDLYVQYVNALQPGQWYSRPLKDWDDDVSNRGDNLTGQSRRFERITSYGASACDLSTDQLLRELAVREDSPLYGSDIPALSSGITAFDYVVGELGETDDGEKGVYCHAVFSTKDEAFNSRTFQKEARSRVFRRTFIEQRQDIR